MDLNNMTLAQLAALFGSSATSAPVLPAQPSAERAVLVTTAHRGVFFGYAADTSGATIKLRAARNCLYWPSNNKGFLGLANMGPQAGSRVGPPADIELRDITCVAAVSAEAAKLWESQPWKE